MLSEKKDFDWYMPFEFKDFDWYMPITIVLSLLDGTADTVLATASHRNTFDTKWASGDAQIHTRRFTPAKLPHCGIAGS